jgi:general secretion pathway protein C
MAIPPRYLVLVNLLLLGLIAYWGASTVTTAVAAKLTPMPKVNLEAPPPPIPAQPNQPLSYYEVIRTRDIFNSKEPEAPSTPPTPAPTQLRLRLWGVAIHHGDKPSYAIIEDLNTRKQELYRIGDQVADAATLVEIEWDRITLERNGQKEFLELTPDASGAGHPQVASARAAPPAPASGGGIEKLGEDQYAIERTEVDSALENMNQLFTQIRAVPHFEGGQSTGFRVFAIRQGSLFDKIGLRNGDIIRRINDTPLTDPARAMSLFQDLRNNRDISVEITRNKENRTLSYQLR